MSSNRRVKVAGYGGLVRSVLLGRVLYPHRVTWLLVGIAVVASAVCGMGCGDAGIVVGVGADSGLKHSYEVLLIPETNAGWAGWRFIAIGGAQGGGCDGAQSHAPVIVEAWNGTDGGGSSAETVGVALTTAVVARVRIGEGGLSVPTRAEKGLPGGLRAAVVKVDGKLRSADGGFPRFIPLNSAGMTIPQSRHETTNPLIKWLSARRVANPARPLKGICEIRSRNNPRDLRVNGGEVISEVHSFSGIIGDGFITCASTSYELYGWPLVASVMISASHPGTAPPSLPDMKPVPGHRGVFSSPGGQQPGPEGELFARRVPGAWLVVGKAKASQRLALLKDLQATLHVGDTSRSTG